MAHTDVTSLIERLDDFEKRVGVRLEALSARIEQIDNACYIDVLGEVHAIDGTSLSSDIEIKLLVYDTSERLMASENTYIDSQTFFGFDSFEFSAELPTEGIARLRIIPKPSA